MQATITEVGGFLRTVSIRKVDRLYAVEFSSQLTSAKHPLERRRNFSMMLNRVDLRVLNQLIEKSLT